MRQVLQNGELVMDRDLLLERTYAVGPLVFDNETGVAAVPNTAEIFHRGVMVCMTPRTFLAITPELDLGERPKTIPFLEVSQRPLGMPFVNFRTSVDSDEVRVRGHEGRHRMYWIAREYGPDFGIPVAMFISENAYSLKAREIDGETVERVCRGVYREISGEFVDGPLFSRAIWSHGEFEAGPPGIATAMSANRMPGR
jgi:hypothetical protein